MTEFALGDPFHELCCAATINHAETTRAIDQSSRGTKAARSTRCFRRHRVWKNIYAAKLLSLIGCSCRAQQNTRRAAFTRVQVSKNAVEYFSQAHDFYQPEAYVPSADIFTIRKPPHQSLDKLRMSATRSLFERRDVIIVASVSCIYGLGSPEAYYGMLVMLEKGQHTSREALLRRLVDIQFERGEDLRRGTFRVRGDMIEIYPTYDDYAYRIEMWGETIDKLRQIDPLTGEVRAAPDLTRVSIYPKIITSCPGDRAIAAVTIQEELGGGKELEKGKVCRGAARRPAQHV